MSVVRVPQYVGKVELEGAKKKRKRFPFQGFINFQGLKIHIENKRGSYRKGKDKDGKPWSILMRHHYGEIEGTKAVDGDPLDVYVGPDAYSPLVVVVRQVKPDTGAYDEDKVMLGFKTEAEAVKAYKAQYNRPGFYGGHEAMPIGKLIAWCADKTKQKEKVAEMLMQVAMRSFLAVIEKTARNNEADFDQYRRVLYANPHGKGVYAVTFDDRDIKRAHKLAASSQSRGSQSTDDLVHQYLADAFRKRLGSQKEKTAGDDSNTGGALFGGFLGSGVGALGGGKIGQRAAEQAALKSFDERFAGRPVARFFARPLKGELAAAAKATGGRTGAILGALSLGIAGAAMGSRRKKTPPMPTLNTFGTPPM
jgi:hypothetical protein